jgi:uridine kinase
MKPFIVGIAGGSGAGKTTFLREILNHFHPGQIALVSQDNYYKPKEQQQRDENGWVNFDLPTSIDDQLFSEHLRLLSTGNSITLLEYNFNNPAWVPQPIEVLPAPIVIMEGLFVFHFEDIREKLDYRVYLDAHHETRLERRIKRDGNERGYPEHEVRYQWENHVRPAEIEFLEPYRDTCELIVANDTHFQMGLNQLINVLKGRLIQS